MEPVDGHRQNLRAETAAMLRRLGEPLLAPLVLLAIIVGFYWKIALTRQYTWINDGDIASQVVPWLQFQAQQWHLGRFPLWDPNEWGGQSLIGQAQPGAAYPLNWLLFLLPLRSGAIQVVYLNGYFVLIHYLGALFCYWLCRDLGRSRAASLLAGAAFSLTGWMGSTLWPQMLNGAVWTPLIFLFMFRVMRAERPVTSAALAGTLLGVSLLSGHHQIPLLVALACGGLWLHLFFLFRDQGRLGGWLTAAAAFAVFFLMAGSLQTLPAYDYGRLSLRWVNGPHPVGWNEAVPYSVHEEFGLRPLSLLGIMLPGIFRHAEPFVGPALILLAVVAVAGAWQERTVRVLAAVALAGLAYSLSSYSILQGILYALVPVVEKARNPSTAIFVFQFGAIVLGAFGLDHYSRASGALTGRVTAALALFAAVILVTLIGFSLGPPTLAPGPYPDSRDKFALIAFSSLLLAAVLHGWRHGSLSRLSAVALVAGVMLVQVNTENSAASWGHREASDASFPQLDVYDDVAAFLRRQPGPVRMEIDGDTTTGNLGDWFGIEAVDEYVASMPANIERVQGWPEARMLLGTNYALGLKPLRPDQVEVFAGRSGIKVYRNPGAFPRVWTVHEAISIDRPDQIVQALQQPLDNLRRRAFLVGDVPRLDQCLAADQARLARHEAGDVVIEIEMSCKGLVVLGDTFDPGWHATVDGRPAAILEAYGFLRGIVVEAGRHRIEMQYVPTAVYLGGLLSGLGLAAACWLAWRGRA